MRVSSFVILIFFALFAPFSIFLLCTLVYALCYSDAYELIILAACIDAQFGTMSYALIPYLYTIAAGAIVFFVEALKPYLTFYEAK